LSKVLALIGQAATRTDRNARKSVLAGYAAVARRYLAERDPLLFQAQAAVEGLLARWQAADAGARESEDWIVNH
jgi:hypothetical protein